MVHGPFRFDVWTDAGRERGDMYCIAHDVAPSPAYALDRILRAQFWRVEMRETAPRRLEKS